MQKLRKSTKQKVIQADLC